MSSRRLHDWLMTRLTESERSEVRLAMGAAMDNLVDASVDENLPQWAAGLGLPTNRATRVMIRSLVETVWAPATQAHAEDDRHVHSEFN